MTNDPLSLPYRLCVGIMLLNPAGKAFVGERLPKAHDPEDNTFTWQMPQGGIDDGESPKEAALRELQEETGVTSVTILREMDRWLAYDLPRDLIGQAMKGRYRGQKQKWFAMRFTGREDEIDIGAKPEEKPEFANWRWVSIDQLPGLIVPFKRAVYTQVVEEFSPLANAA